MLPTSEILVAAVGCSRATAELFVQPLRDACAAYEINTAARLAAFLAQVGHESLSFTRLSENLNYSAGRLIEVWPKRFTRETAPLYARQPEKLANFVYADRLGNGDAASGDGWRFRGRGLIGNTGKANYEGVTELVRRKLADAPDFVAKPDALTQPKWAAFAAAAFWDEHGLNEPADRGQFDKITARINGAQTGAEDRRNRYQRARRVLQGRA